MIIILCRITDFAILTVLAVSNTAPDTARVFTSFLRSNIIFSQNGSSQSASSPSVVPCHLAGIISRLCAYVDQICVGFRYLPRRLLRMLHKFIITNQPI